MLSEYRFPIDDEECLVIFEHLQVATLMLTQIAFKYIEEGERHHSLSLDFEYLHTKKPKFASSNQVRVLKSTFARLESDLDTDNLWQKDDRR